MDITQPPQWLKDVLPDGARDILDPWGWWAVLAVLALIVLLVLWSLLRKVFSRGPKPHPSEKDLEERLATYPEVRPSTGDRRLLVEGVPVRLRLVVVAPAGAASKVDPANIDKLLEKVLPGLGDIAGNDRPRVKVWPLQLSYEGFANTFHRRTILPEGEDQPSRWVMLAGRAMVGKNQFLLGLGLQALTSTTVGRKTLKSHDWTSVLRVRVRD